MQEWEVVLAVQLHIYCDTKIYMLSTSPPLIIKMNISKLKFVSNINIKEMQREMKGGDHLSYLLLIYALSILPFTMPIIWEPSKFTRMWKDYMTFLLIKGIQKTHILTFSLWSVKWTLDYVMVWFPIMLLGSRSHIHATDYAFWKQKFFRNFNTTYQ